MNNPRFVDEEEIPLVQDKDYDDYNAANTSRVDETSFIEPAATEATSFQAYDGSKKKGATIFEFLNGYRWVSLTKQTGEFFAPKTLRDKFVGINAMKNFLGTDRTPPLLERLISAAGNLKTELPTD